MTTARLRCVGTGNTIARRMLRQSTYAHDQSGGWPPANRRCRGLRGGFPKTSLKRVLRIRGRHPFRAEFCSLSGTEISREIAVYHRTEVRLTRNNSSMSAAEVTPSIELHCASTSGLWRTLRGSTRLQKNRRRKDCAGPTSMLSRPRRACPLVEVEGRAVSSSAMDPRPGEKAKGAQLMAMGQSSKRWRTRQDSNL